MQNYRKSRAGGRRVHVLCQVDHISERAAAIWISNPGQSLTVKSSHLTMHPATKKNLCSAGLVKTENNVATVIVGQYQNKPVELLVPAHCVFFEVGGNFFRFTSWKQMDRARRNSRKGPKDQGFVGTQPLLDL